MDHAPVGPSIGRQADPGAYACSPSPANASPRIVRFPFIGTGIGTGSIRVQWWRCAAHSALPRPVRGLPSRRAPSECAAPASTAFQAGVWVWTAHVGVEDPNADLDARWTTKFAGRGGAPMQVGSTGVFGASGAVRRGRADSADASSCPCYRLEPRAPLLRLPCALRRVTTGRTRSCSAARKGSNWGSASPPRSLLFSDRDFEGTVRRHVSGMVVGGLG